MTTTSDNSTKKFTGLEVLRFLAACVIVITHYGHFQSIGPWQGHSAWGIGKLPFATILEIFYRHGFVAVWIFWSISGFIFFWKYADSAEQRTISLARFGWLRISRLYPLHLVTLLFVAFTQIIYVRLHGVPFIYADNNTWHFLQQLLMASNWTQSSQSFNGPIWSVSMELPIYLLFFMSSRYFGKSAYLCALLMFIMNILPFAPILWRIDGNVRNCIQFFFMGGLVQIGLSRLTHVHQKFAVFGLSAVMLLILVIAWNRMWVGVTPLTMAVFSATSIAAIVLLPEVVTRLSFDRAVRLGDLSYASYLLHFPMQISIVVLLDAAGVPRSIMLHPLMFLLFLIAVFLAASVTYRHFERPAQNWLRSWPVDRRTLSRWFA